MHGVIRQLLQKLRQRRVHRLRRFKAVLLQNVEQAVAGIDELAFVDQFPVVGILHKGFDSIINHSILSLFAPSAAVIG